MRTGTISLSGVSARGFTLLEFMAALAVLGVLLAIGVPAFTETIRNNRAVGQANELIGALTLARSEAAKLGFPVSVCAANAARNGCAGGTVDDWSNGWLVFTDNGSTAGAVDASESILLSYGPVHSSLQLETNDLGFVRFASNGGTTNAAAIPNGTAAILFELRPDTCTGTNRREIRVERTGRPSLRKLSCT